MIWVAHAAGVGDNTKAPSQLDMGDNERANRTGESDRRGGNGISDYRRTENFKKLRICVNRIVELQTAKCWDNMVTYCNLHGLRVW